MNLFKFLKWFFKEKKTAAIVPIIIVGIIVGLSIFVQCTQETVYMWIFYTVIPVFNIGYYLVQYRAYKKMVIIEELKNNNK